MELEQELKNVFSQTFNISQEKISLKTRQVDLAEWDSLGQLRLIMEIETVFNVSFLIDEIATLDSFEKILYNIQTKQKVETNN